MNTTRSRTRPRTLLTEAARRELGDRQDRPDLHKSFLMTRLLIGIVGFLLPTFIIIWDLTLDRLANRPAALLGSLSAYYYQPRPLGDWFVGSLWAIGVGLLVYVGTRKSLFASVVSAVAGLAAVVVTLFPTNDGGTPSTWVSNLHFFAAAVVVIGLGALCVGFGIYDKERKDQGQGRTWYQAIHFGAAFLILAAIVIVVLHKLFGLWPDYGVLVAELVAVYAFAISWFAKGVELFAGIGKRVERREGPEAPETAPDPDQDPHPVLAGSRATP